MPIAALMLTTVAVAGLLMGLRLGRRGHWYGWPLAIVGIALLIVAGAIEDSPARPLFGSGGGLVLLGLMVQPRRDRLALLLIAAGIFFVLAGAAATNSA
jgi:hypothetical protein